MPLIKSRSKAAFKKNVETEMKAHPGDTKKDLAIAYSVKRKAPKKKMAEGGSVTSAATEKRPMPKYRSNDSMQVGENANKKELIDDQWTSRPDIKQSTKGMKTTPIKHPKMVPQSLYSARLRDEEDDLQMSDAPASPKEQPSKADDEIDATKRGEGPEKQKRFSDDLNMYAEGGKINKKVPMKAAEEDNLEEPAGLESDDDQMSQPKNEYMSDEMPMFAEGGETDSAMEVIPDKGYGKIIRVGLAEGGEASTDEEQAIEHAASIAAAIMAKRKMAEGGEVDLDLNKDEQPNGYYEQNEHMETYGEDLNDMNQPEDSNEMGDSREDEEENQDDASLVGKIRKSMKRKSALTR